MIMSPSKLFAEPSLTKILPNAYYFTSQPRSPDDIPAAFMRGNRLMERPQEAVADARYEKSPFMKAKLAIAGLLLFLATAGFFWYSQPGTKLSDTDTILIANFSNATGEPVLDSSLQEALAISLSQSPSLNLVSVEKVAEALRSLGRPLETVVTRDLAPQLCQRLGATV